MCGWIFLNYFIVTSTESSAAERFRNSISAY